MHSVGGAIGIGGVLPQNSVGGSFAFGTEFVTDGGLENWTDDTPDDWDEDGESAGVRDITKETTEIHGGSAGAKLEATDNDGTDFDVRQVMTLIANKYYEASWWSKYASRTAGRMMHVVYNSTDLYIVLIIKTAVDSAYTQRIQIFKPTVIISSIYSRLSDETTTGIVYFDDISVRDVDLIARRYGGDLIGAIGMQQIALWDKWNTN